MNEMITQPLSSKFNPVVKEHSDLRDVSLFEEHGRVKKAPIFVQTKTGRTDDPDNRVYDWSWLVNANSNEPLPMKPVSSRYNLVLHPELFDAQATTIYNNPNLPHENIRCVDTIYENGAKATRTVFFDDLQWDIDGQGTVTARTDTVNSYDSSWAFQLFAGAYRSYCRNTCVFGGRKTFHAKKKHTPGLNVQMLLESSMFSVSDFENARLQMEQWKNTDIFPWTFANLLERTLCKVKANSRKSGSEINERLKGYLISVFNAQKSALGSTAWNAYNAMTQWSSHHAVDWIDIDSDNNSVTRNTGSITGNPHTVLADRQHKVRTVLSSPEWEELARAA